MNNPEKVAHAKKYPQTSFYRSLFAFYEPLLKVRVVHEKKTTLFLSGTREKTEKMPSTRRERKFYIRCARAPSAFCVLGSVIRGWNPFVEGRWALWLSIKGMKQVIISIHERQKAMKGHLYWFLFNEHKCNLH